jgi:hypothetical protein
VIFEPFVSFYFGHHVFLPSLDNAKLDVQFNFLGTPMPNFGIRKKHRFSRTYMQTVKNFCLKAFLVDFKVHFFVSGVAAHCRAGSPNF